LRGDVLVDLSWFAPTMSALLELADPVSACARATSIGRQPRRSTRESGYREHLHLLAPCDLQPIKAAGVTFAASMLERVIEEQARGDPRKAERCASRWWVWSVTTCRKCVPGHRRRCN